MSAPCLLEFGSSLDESIKGPRYPLWLDGWYVDAEPNHHFYAMPREGAIIMDWYGFWVGAESDDVTCIFKSDARYGRNH